MTANITPSQARSGSVPDGCELDDDTSVLLTHAGLYLGDGRWTTGALLVVNGNIADVSEDDPSGARIGKTTVPEETSDAWDTGTLPVLDVGGATVLPGFQDAHVHPPTAGAALLGIDLSGVHSWEGYRSILEEARQSPGTELLLGNGWYGDAFPGGLPTAAILDTVIPDRPVVLLSHDGHGLWMNTRVLEAAGIDRDTPDPADGVVVRNEAGEPTGVLLDGAMNLVEALIPAPTQESVEQALLAAQEYLHAVGVTAWQDAMVGDAELGPDPQPAYIALAESGQLTARVVQALWWDRTRGLEQIPDLVERRAAVEHLPGMSAHVVKIMQDGMVENRTAAMLAPYGSGCCGGAGEAPSVDGSSNSGGSDDTAPAADEGDRGPSFIDPQLLTQATIELERAGFDVHFHGVGDRAVRECLDAVEAAAAVRSGGSDWTPRHQIAHLDVVDPADLPRFAALDVIANIQMLWARKDKEIVERKLPLLGREREGSHFPFGSLKRAGAQLAAGSDWPVSAPDPLLAIHTAVARLAPPADVHAVGDEVFTTPLQRQEALDFTTALDAYLSGAAYANRLEEFTGRIAVGMAADLVVLDADLRTAPSIGDVRVARTLVAGRTVYTRT